MAVELDQVTRYLAAIGEYRPQNLVFEKGQPITFPWEGNSEFPDITILMLNECEGTIDAVTFSKLPALQTIHFTNCEVTLQPGAFSTRKKLEIISFFKSRVDMDKSPVSSAPLTNFKHLSFHKSILSGLNRNVLHDFDGLDKLIIDNSEVSSIDNDAFDDLTKITQLEIKTTKIPQYDFSQILKLTTLEYLALHDLETSTHIDYNIFKSLPKLNTLLFDTLAYKDLDFAAFPKLKTVEIGLGDTRDSMQLNDNALYNGIMDRLESFKPKGIESKIVHAGKTRTLSLAVSSNI